MRIDRSLLLGSGILLLIAILLPALSWRSGGSEKHGLEKTLGVPADGSWGIAVLFQPSDCRERLESLRVWNAFRDRSGLAVSGLVLGSEIPADLEGAMADWGIEIPVRAVELRLSARQALIRAGFRSTPLMIVQDPAGRVRAIAALDHLSTAEEVRAFVHNLLPI